MVERSGKLDVGLGGGGGGSLSKNNDRRGNSQKDVDSQPNLDIRKDVRFIP